ncbi:hypothetical protein OsI_12221 [Oryza sativa Indica Group]|uniref:Uncharacterized protein n=2 Tax=Oryza sativa TaxID=4530 RepID=B9F987_ORYSJ|nr:hypothetical protein OsI_12221 [Oryza sativa Indica Group]EEE59335.1 hypothetical protein OsJ_11416 [Oryza sativa Japonica Group]
MASTSPAAPINRGLLDLMAARSWPPDPVAWRLMEGLLVWRMEVLTLLSVVHSRLTGAAATTIAGTARHPPPLHHPLPPHTSLPA